MTDAGGAAPRATATGQRMEQVGPVHDESIRGEERVLRLVATWGHRTRRATRRYDRGMSLLLLVDLDGVVYRGADPVPGVAAVLAARAAAGDDVVYVTNNSMHYRADYVTRLAAMGAPVSAGPGRLVVAGDRAPPPRPRTGHPTRAGAGRRRPRARTARCRSRRRDDRRRGDPDDPGADRRLRGGRRAGCGRRRPRPEPDLPAPDRRRRLHPGRRPVHRHEPRPDLPDGARPSAWGRLHRGRPGGDDRGHAAVDRQAGPAAARDRRGGRRPRCDATP